MLITHRLSLLPLLPQNIVSPFRIMQRYGEVESVLGKVMMRRRPPLPPLPPGPPPPPSQVLVYDQVPQVYREKLSKVLGSIRSASGARMSVLGVDLACHLAQLMISGSFHEVTAARKIVHKMVSDWMGGIKVTLPDVARTSANSSDAVHVFVDNSNMHIGAQRASPAAAATAVLGGSASMGPSYGSIAVTHLQYTALKDRVVRGREVKRLFVGGVMPDAVYRKWHELGFTVQRGTDDDAGAHIDELLHAQMLDTVTSVAVPGVLVLLTGDGNQNSGRSSFPKCVVAALRAGWMVEVYCWRHSTSSVFMALESLSQGRLKLQFLDEWRDEVSFETSRVRSKANDGKAAFLGTMAAITKIDPVKVQPERPFPEVLKQAVEVVRRCTVDTGGHGVLGSAFKSKFLEIHGHEMQLTFCGQRVKVKDVLDLACEVQCALVNTQPVFRFRGGLRAAEAAAPGGGASGGAGSPLL